MPPRPHDAEESPRDRDDDRADEHDDEALGGPADDGAGGEDEPSDASDLLDPAEVDARFARIVTELGAPAPADPRAWAPDPAVEEAEDHFEPPDPGPVLGGDPLLTMAWVVVVGVPVLLMIAVIAWRDMPTWLLQAAGAAFLAGVGLLLWRMPRDREDDTGPGAVV